ncbi:MAG: GYD domain-containing protein [Gemmatimonadetes bacterium]|nr:GYD domain-containing protein [Gemmatimonadota bacterium]
MPTYITLARWTDKGIAAVKESPKRLNAVKKLLREQGGRLRAFYLVTGTYDLVVVMELPDDSTMARVALLIGTQGNVRTETLRAYTEDEYRKIIASLP